MSENPANFTSRLVDTTGAPGTDCRRCSCCQGIVYSGGQVWTGTHDAWLRGQRFTSPAVQMTLESDYDAVLTVKARRDRLEPRSQRWQLTRS